MKAAAACVLAILVLQAGAFAQPIRVVTGSGATALEKYAAHELRSYLPRITEQEVLGGGEEGGAAGAASLRGWFRDERSGERAAAQEPDATLILVGTRQSNPALKAFTPALPASLAEQEIVVRSGREGGRAAVAVTGGSPPAVLWAAYTLLGKLGVIFEFSGQILPAKKARVRLTGLRADEKPTIAHRGLRLHLNFPMDQSSYSLHDFLAWVDRMARMKFNYVMFHFYSAHPWFYFRYRDAETHTGTFFVGSYLFGGRYMLPDDMIGRSLIQNRHQYFPPGMEGMKPGVELYRRTEERMRAVMDRCHARGIKVAVSFEPLSPPGDIASHLNEWQKDFPSREALMEDVTVHRLLACMKAYPQADEYQLISVEGSSDAPAGMDLKAELRRLCRKYGLPFNPGDEASFRGAREAGVNLTPYNAPASAEALSKGLYLPVVSTLRYVDLALQVFADPRIADRFKREGKQSDIGIYLPNAAAIKLCLPALRGMLPPGQRLQLMVDYGARGTADQMPTWDVLRGADLKLGIITWLEFDGSMFLPQAWPHSVYDCVHNARGLPVTTMVANHWRVSGPEADAAALSEAPWEPKLSYDAWFDGYLAGIFGAAHVPLARKAYDALEQATLYCRAHLFNVGFCFEGRYLGNYGYPQQYFDGAKRLFDQARVAFAALAKTQPPGRSRVRAEYLADRCQCADYHLEAMQQMAGTQVSASASPAQAKAAAEHAAKALELAKDYMRTYARFVLDRGDQGMLVDYHFAMVYRAEQAERNAKRLAILAASDAAAPVMAWDFEKGDAKTVPDATGHGFDATCVGHVAYAPGRHGRALKLDGASYLRVKGAAIFNPKSFTVSAWIKPARVDVRRGIVGKRVQNTSAPFVLCLENGALSFEGCGTSGNFWPFNFSGPAVAPGKWTHVAATLEAGKQIVLYMDGKPVATKAISESPSPNAEPLVIGREAWGGEGGQQSPGFFRGLIDDVKIWKRALSAEEVAAEAGR